MQACTLKWTNSSKRQCLQRSIGRAQRHKDTLPSAVRTATAVFRVQSSGLVCSWPGTCYQTTYEHSFDSFRHDLETAYTAQLGAL